MLLILIVNNLYNKEYFNLKNLSLDQLINRNLSNVFIWYLLGWISVRLNFDFVIIQFLCISIFLFSLFKLSLRYSNPWILIIFSFHFIVVFGINYPRQIITIGLFLIIIDHILNSVKINNLKIILLLFLSIGFHTASIFLFPLTFLILLIYFNNNKSKIKLIILISLMMIPVLITISNTIFSQLRIYLLSNIFNDASSGASLRILSYLLPLFVLLLFL